MNRTFKYHTSVLTRKAIRAVEEELEDFLGLLIQTANFWSELLKLRFQTCLVGLKLRYALRKQRHLLKRVTELSVQNRELLLRQRDALVFHRSRCDVPDDAFNGVEHISGGVVMLANGQAQRLAETTNDV